MRRLIANRVFVGLVTAWRFADCPTSTSSSCVNATTDGVVRSPSLFSRTLAVSPSMTATHEFVVPRSIPMILPISGASGAAGKSHVPSSRCTGGGPIPGAVVAEARSQGILGPPPVFQPRPAYFATMTIAGRTRRSLSR